MLTKNARQNEYSTLQINGAKSETEQLSAPTPPCGDLGVKLGAVAKSNLSQTSKKRV